MLVGNVFHFTTLLFLLAFVFNSEDFVRGEQRMKGNCSYIVTIETSCIREAGTLNQISLRFGDESSNDIYVHPLNRKHVKQVDRLGPSILDDVPRKPFQPCSVDVFQVDAPCVDTTICYLYFKLRGSDDWQPSFSQVRVLDLPQFNSDYFYFRRYLPRHIWHGYDLCDREVTPSGIHH